MTSTDTNDPEIAEASERSVLSGLNNASCFKFMQRWKCGALRCTLPTKFIFLGVATVIQLVVLIFGIVMVAMGNEGCVFEGLIVGVASFSAGLVAPSPLDYIKAR